jgi:hypothetical protein
VIGGGVAWCTPTPANESLTATTFYVYRKN